MSFKKILANLGLLALALAIIAVQIIRPLFNIQQINCQVENQPCPPELQSTIEQLKGRSFFFTNFEQRIREFDQQFYQFESLSKTFPQTISLTFTTQPTNYQLLMVKENQTWQVASNGLAQELESPTPHAIRVENWPQALTDNQVDSQLHQIAQQLSMGVTQHQFETEQVIIRDQQNIELQLKNSLTAILDKDSIPLQLAKLSVILDEVDIQTIDLGIKKIDLRFDYPVLMTN